MGAFDSKAVVLKPDNPSTIDDYEKIINPSPPHHSNDGKPTSKLPLNEIKIAVGQWLEIRKRCKNKKNSCEYQTYKKLEEWMYEGV